MLGQLDSRARLGKSNRVLPQPSPGSRLPGHSVSRAIQQAPRAAYDLFDKVCLSYQGHQIFFGETSDAQCYFEDMGFECPPQQTVPDFLTSLTSPPERRARKGFEGRVPDTPHESASAWRSSESYRLLMEDIASFNQKHPLNGERYNEFFASRRAQQSRHM